MRTRGLGALIGTVAGLLAAAPATPARAQTDFNPAYCGAPTSVRSDPELLARREDPATEATIDADEVEYFAEDERYVFSGNVVLEQADQRLRADRVTFDGNTRRVDASGNFRYRESGLALSGETGHLYLDSNQGALSAASFRFEHSYAHGEAEEILIEDAERTRYNRARFTTCPPDQEDWWLNARRLDIDREEGLATARGARMDFFGVPIFYTPYISFPIDDRRRSGFLAPSFGYSDSSGLDLRIPYYLNLAPNYDAVIAPRIISRRGVMLETEGRLLTRRFYSEAEVQYLPDDSLYGESRWLGRLQLDSPAAARLQWSLDARRVSDDDFLEDFSSGFANTSADHLLSQASASYALDDWQLSAQAQTWQTVNPLIPPADQPYRTLPRIRLQHRPQLGPIGLEYRLDSEFTYFDHPEPLVTGSRLDIMPTLSQTWEGLAYFVTPAVALRHTQYWLDNTAPEAGEQLSRTVPIFSLDSGIFLERELGFGERPLLQTLEPRLFYVYIPERAQDNLPIFDTDRSELTLSQLFRTDRYAGADRVGDTNQISAAVTTRLLDRRSGREHLSAALGRAFYFEDREVLLRPAEELAQARRSASDIMAELRGRVGDFSAFAEYQWDPYDSLSRKRALQLSYRPQDDAVVNVGYRQRRFGAADQLEQADISFAWPLGARWLGFGGWRYSLLESTHIERFAGVEFYNCCWSARVLAREYVRDLGREPDREIMFQLSFIGLADVGQRIQEFVTESVPGFSPTR